MNLRSPKTTLQVLAIGAVAAATIAPTAATAARPKSGCSVSAGSAVYSWAHDRRSYVPLPGESWDSMGGQGWSLTGGANFETSTLLDGNSGTVLDLPTGSVAISPPVCVTNKFPMARTEIRDLAGSRGVAVYVLYGRSTQQRPSNLTADVTGSGAHWSLYRAFNIVRSAVSQPRQARFALVPRGAASEYQLSNFFVDPRMHR